MNLYGYGAGDPINNSDPFGLSPDTLIIEDERLAADVKTLRANNAKTDSTFSLLEKSTSVFVLVDVDAVFCDVCPGTGQSWDTKDQAQRAAFPGTFDWISANDPNARGLAYTRRSRLGSAADGAWHEAGHLRGIVETGSMYKHPSCPAAVLGIPAWRCE